MPAPRDIIDSLESVISIYFSDVRHKLRAAFLLADELVEATGKAQIPVKELKAKDGHFNFYDVLTHSKVGLDPKKSPLGDILARNHATRNQLQHGNAAFTVDDQHCADAILDAVAAIEHCFPGTTAGLAESIKVALRIVRLHSSQGNVGLRGRFEDTMHENRWNGVRRRARVNEPPIPVGIRRY